eukprot:6826923-Prymnesium_polylepis.1
MVYVIETSDDGAVICGYGAEAGTAFKEAVVMKVTSAGATVWAWRSGAIGQNEVCNSVVQLPSGVDILIAGYKTVSSVATGFVTKLSLSTGAAMWASDMLFPASESGLHSALESLSVSATHGVLVAGLNNIADTSEMAFRSYGNVPTGNAILQEYPVSAFTASTPPTVFSASWTKEWGDYLSCKAAHFLPDGKVAALTTADGAFTSLTVLNGATNVAVWGPTNFYSVHGEGTDMKVSADGNTIVISGQGAPSTGALAGRLTAASASTGTHLWTTTFDSGGTPTLIYNECWGVGVTADGGYVVGCGTGIENCEDSRNTAACHAGNGDTRAGAYPRGASIWQSLVVKIDASGTLLWQRVD